MTKLYASLILTAFIVAAVFGLYLVILAPAEHHSGCPFSAAAEACVSQLEHLTHWQSSFAAIAAELVVLFALALAILGSTGLPDLGLRQYRAYRLRERVPRRPTLLQELFSQGILHRKEPQIAYAAIINPFSN